MAKHRALSIKSIKARTMVGGLVAGGAMALAAPMGMASAVPTDTGNPSADAVGRPGFENPAPGVRIAQAIGDRIYNDSTPLNAALNASPLGEGYHARLGTTSTGEQIENPDFDPTKPVSATNPATIVDPGTNGRNPGQLNIEWARLPYNALGLPKEKDLPGTVVKFFAGEDITTVTAKSSSSNCVNSTMKIGAQAAKC
jgi:hypothetical protein